VKSSRRKTKIVVVHGEMEPFVDDSTAVGECS
jgi:hypothetical protein